MFGSMSTNFEIFEEELRLGLGPDLGWGWQLTPNTRLRMGSMSTNLEFFEEELNAGAGWGWGQIKVGVGNSFLTPD